MQSQIAHYKVLNGRSVVHFFAQLFLYIGKPIFNIINSFVFLGLIFLIYFYSYGSFKNFNIPWFLLINFILWGVTPAFGESFLWLTGSSNYMYGIFIVLIFLLPYRIKLNDSFKDVSNNGISMFLMAIMYFFIGIMAGWTNENTSISLIIMIILFLFNYKIQNIRYSLWMFTGLAGSIFGCILMLTSPGQASRLSDSGGFGGIIEWLKRFCFISLDLFNYLIPIIIFLVFCIIIYIYFKNDTKSKNYNELSLFSIFFIGTLTSIYSMIASPSFPDRVWSGPIIIFTIAIGNIYSLIDWNKKKLIKTIIISIVILCSFNFISNYINAFLDLKQVKIQNDLRVSYIEDQKNKDNLNISTDTIKGYTKYSCFSYNGDLDENKNNWPNTAIAKYYSVEFISKK